MRVLLTTDTIGGVWTFTKELASELLARGHAVALVSFGRSPSTAQSAWCEAVHATHGQRFRYEASTAPLEWMQSNAHARTAAAPLLLRIAEEFSPDLLHSNQFCFGSLPISIPRLITAHSDVLSWADACRPNGLEPSPWLSQYQSLVQTGLTAATAIAAPTHWMLEALHRHFTLTAPTHVILNGRTPPETDTPPPAPRRLQAVSAGRLWDEAKDIALLAQVASPIPILVAGEHRHEAANAPAHLGPVQLLGPLEEPALQTLFQASSIYIATSIYEPFGLAPLEAAQHGCAILARDIPSLREVWGTAALYFQDAATLSHLLHHVATSENALLQARHASQTRARQLTAARMANQYLDLYRVLLAPAPASREELAAHAR